MKPIKVTEDRIHKGLYRLEWADGVLSADVYNLTRAKDILKNYDFYRKCMLQDTPTKNSPVDGP